MDYKKIFPGIALGLAILLGGSKELMCQMKPIEFTKEKLANGLEVIYHIDRSAPVVGTIVHYRVGSRDEFANQTATLTSSSI